MALLQVNVLPLGTATPSVSRFVADALNVAEASGATYQVGPMSTCLEGPLEQMITVALQMHQACFSEDVQRVVTTITIDDRRDKEATLQSKISAVSQ